MDNGRDDRDVVGRTAGVPPRKEYRPPTLVRIEVGRRTASGNRPDLHESTSEGASYCSGS